MEWWSHPSGGSCCYCGRSIVEYSASKLNQISALTGSGEERSERWKKYTRQNPETAAVAGAFVAGIGLIQFVPIRALYGNGGWRFMAEVIIK